MYTIAAVGLMRDDLIPADHSVIQEALGRLTDKESFDRTFRLRRAIQLYMAHEELPLHEQIPFEQDQPYLFRHMQNVCRERDEKHFFDNLMPSKEPREFIKQIQKSL